MKALFDSIPDKIIKEEPLRLVCNRTKWIQIRDLKLYDFTDEQLANAPNNKGFICNSNGADLYLLPLL